MQILLNVTLRNYQEDFLQFWPFKNDSNLFVAKTITDYAVGCICKTIKLMKKLHGEVEEHSLRHKRNEINKKTNHNGRVWKFAFTGCSFKTTVFNILLG